MFSFSLLFEVCDLENLRNRLSGLFDGQALIVPQRSPQKSTGLGKGGPAYKLDYRWNRVVIECATVRHMEAPTSSSSSPSPSLAFSLEESVEVDFSPENTEVLTGIVHLFRTTKESTKKSLMVAILAVPSYLSPASFLQFVAPMRRATSNMRIVRDWAQNRYMVLLKFRDLESAEQFTCEYNGKQFSSIEPEVCHVVYIDRIEFTSPNETDPFVRFSDLDVVELPSCPVCLECMDSSVTGIFTNLCSHSFHCQCLSKWGDSSCPVCRYRQKPLSDAQTKCNECDEVDGLWMCLICGNAACGRYQSAHAYNHFLTSQHPYAMEIETQRVWDYYADGYVHRLIQSKTDGKLVEVPGPNEAYPTAMDEARVSQDKLEAMGLEFGYILSAQLESQRVFYEEKLDALEAQLSSASARFDFEIQELRKHFVAAEEQNAQLKGHCSAIKKEKQQVQERAQLLEEELAKLRKLHEEEEQLNRSLRLNQVELQKQLGQRSDSEYQLKRQIEEIQEQLRDVMFHMDTQSTVADSPHKSEIQEGKICMEKKASSSKNRGRR